MQLLIWNGQRIPGDLKLIIIAGNESFAQGEFPHEKACKLAAGKDIVINTIFCGDFSEGVRMQWKEGALAANGKYLNIDQGDQVVHIPTPFDDYILELNQRLNDTYIGYGDVSIKKLENQVAQDANAGSISSANSRTRAFFKCKPQYKNYSWDLVDFTNGRC